MISLELKWALVLYTAVLAAIALFIWVYTELTVRRPQRYLGQQFLWRCTFCGFSYLDETNGEMSKCPRCESLIAATDAYARAVPVAQHHEPQPNPDLETGKNTSRRKRHHQRRRGPRRR